MAVLAAALISLASPAVAQEFAETGADGADGAPGGPGLPGANGIAGDDATLIVEGGADVRVTTRAGDGGQGGDGGNTSEPTLPGGDGGHGGGGGDATAIIDITTSAGDTLARSSAHGGIGGRGGAAGRGLVSGSDGRSGQGGAAGRADAQSFAEGTANVGAAAQAFAGRAGGGAPTDSVRDPDEGAAYAHARGHSSGGDVTVVAAARGADVSSPTTGSGRARDGGHAFVVSEASVEGDGHLLQTNLLRIIREPTRFHGAFGGRGGNVPYTGPFLEPNPDDLRNAGDGGDAHSTTRGEAFGNSIVAVTDTATAGDAGSTGGAGNGGAGGNANSHAEAIGHGSSEVAASATATAGFGGSSALGQGGAAGTATATARAVSHGGGDAWASAQQQAASRGTGEGRGLDERADASTMENAVSGSTSGRLDLRQVAIGGEGRLHQSGGHARSILTNRNPGGGDLELEAVARGGNGGLGNLDGTGSAGGGNADAYAGATTSGATALRITALAEAGNGLTVGSAAGTATARAEGHSTGGGDVHVTARETAGNGGPNGGLEDLTLINAVSGSTTGALRLEQWIGGGTGYDADAGSQNAISILHARNPAGGSVSGSSSARGGTGTTVGIFPAELPVRLGDGGDAHAIGTAIDDGSAGAEISVTASGGNGGSHGFSSFPTPPPIAASGHGGAATLGEVFASSNGGAVSARGAAYGGSASRTSGAGGDGHGVALKDAVKGATAGDLYLAQTARGGDGGSSLGGDLVPVAGSAGDASSELTKYTSSSSLTLDVTAEGGRGGVGFSGGEASSGGNATSDGLAWNDAGSVTVCARAEGGVGGGVDRISAADAPPSPKHGGHATNRARAITLGDGHDIEITPVRDSFGSTEPAVSALGGRGGGNASLLGPAPEHTRPGNGGNATSHSFGDARGDSAVSVLDVTTGGDAGRVSFASRTMLPGGAGGNAHSSATAMNRGTSRVFARADAQGGRAFNVESRYGNANATSSARGHGEVVAESMANAGALSADSDPIGGDAHASSHAESRFDALAMSDATGRNGSAQSTSRITTDSLVEHASIESTSAFETLSAMSTSSLSQIRLDSSSNTPDLAAIDSYGLMVVAHHSPVVAADPLAEIQLGGGHSATGGVETFDQLVVVEMVLDLEALDGEDPLGLVMFDGANVSGDGFESLSFSVEMGDVVLIEEHFEDESEAASFFATSLFSLGVPGNRSGEHANLRITFDFDTTGDPGRFDTQIALKQIPEPGTGVGVGLGIVIIAATRRRTRRRPVAAQGLPDHPAIPFV